MSQTKVGSARPSSFVADRILGKLRTRNQPAKGRPPKVRPSVFQGTLSSQFPRRLYKEGTMGCKSAQASSTSPFTQRPRSTTTTRKGKPPLKGARGTWQSAVSDGNGVCVGSSMIGASSRIVKHTPCKYISDKSITPDHAPPKPGCFIEEGDLWISNPSSIPDFLLDLPIPKAID